MSDILDHADSVADMLLRESLSKKIKVPELTGFCLSCDEPTTGAFCSKECREDYERIERANNIKGTPSI